MESPASTTYNPAHAIQLPVSKSIGARYLVASYFAGTLGACRKFTDSDDLKVIQQALLDLMINEEWLGTGEPPLDIHASGTAFRFVTAVAASTPGADFLITGTPRLCSRPMAPMLGVLRRAGASIEARGENTTGPYRVLGRRLKGGDYEIKGDVSSQFISALMLVAPTWDKGVRLRFTTPLVSRPYAEMTAGVMEKFGIGVTLSETEVEIRPGDYLAPRNFNVEADWSAAGFFYEAASLMEREIDIAGLTAPDKSLQGDSATAMFFEMLGVYSTFNEEGVALQNTGEIPVAIEADLTDNPDLVPALAVACAMNGCRFRFTGVRNLRLKECDRLDAMMKELGKLGFVVNVEEDALEWAGDSKSTEDVPVETYDDHRIAMAFAMAALKLGSIRIKNPDVVNKSFEDFWNQLPKLGLRCTKENDIITVTKV